MFMSDDPIADFNRKDAEETAWLERRPVCGYCHEPIQDEFLYDINDEFICEDCLNQHFRKHTEDFVL